MLTFMDNRVTVLPQLKRKW